MTRGLTNNNPGNIDRGSIAWQGMADDQSGDPRFIVFKTPQYGIRALAKTLLTYQNQYHLNTVRGIISRWAPSVENNTAAYVAAVCAGVGVGPDDEIDVDTTAIMLPLCKAIILHENGSQPYSDTTITEGLKLAGIADAPAKPLVTQGTFVTKAVAAGSLGVGGCVDACKALISDPSKVHGLSDQVKDAAGQLDAFTGVAIFDHVKTALITVGGGLLLASMALSVMKQRAS